MKNHENLYKKALTHYKDRNFTEAEKIFREILSENPHHAHSMHMMAAIGYDVERYDLAEELVRMAIHEKEDEADFYLTLGNILAKRKKLEDALQSFHKATQLNPNHVGALLNVARICRDQGGQYRNSNMFEAAIHHYKRALEIRPNADDYTSLGYIYYQLGRYSDAIEVCKECIKHYPRLAKAYDNMASCYGHINKFEEAYTYSKKALSLNPKDPTAHAHMATTLKNLGRLDEAIESLNKSLSLDPSRDWIFSNLILTMLYASSVTPEKLADTSRQFGEKLADPLIRKRPFTNDRDPNRKLRIGYVSPDFRNHAVCFFLSPIFLADKKNFEIFAYSKVQMEDQITYKIKNSVDHWRDFKHTSDEDAANIVENDKIDILIDLAGHTANNGLMIFARKPAPIQLTWLGYTATTGMKAMDYRMTDAYAEPPGMTEHLNVETLWRLPEIFCAYSPKENSPDVIDHPPFEDNGYITFGCFNNFTKVTDPVLDTWAKILERIPDARLLLEIAGIQSNKVLLEVKERLAAHNLPMDRVILEPRKSENQYVLYNKIDVALDPFPAVGGTTSMDTLWMGVPFVTLAGHHFGSRLGVTLLKNAGLTDLIAEDNEAYIKIAVALANDRDRLRNIRSGLRDRVKKSPLMDEERFVKNWEDALRQMWQKWVKEN